MYRLVLKLGHVCVCRRVYWSEGGTVSSLSEDVFDNVTVVADNLGNITAIDIREPGKTPLPLLTRHHLSLIIYTYCFVICLATQHCVAHTLTQSDSNSTVSSGVCV